MRKKQFFGFIGGLFFSIFLFNLEAQTLEEAETFAEQGLFVEANSIYEHLIKKSSNNIAVRDSWSKVLLKMYDYDRVIELLSTIKGKKKDASLALLAEAYYHSYRFPEAIQTINLMGGKKKIISEEMKLLNSMAQRASKMLEYSEWIEVIDSVQIDLSHLENFPQGHLSKEWGTFLKNREIISKAPAYHPVYQTSLGHERFFSMQGEQGDMELFYTRKVGAKWTETLPLNSLNTSFEEIYPILRQDGITLIFSRKSPDGIGGYDLYLTRKNIDTNEFLSPTLLGMPFNSPFNDYFLIYDDLYKIGVLASDRYCPEGKVHIYTFRLSEQSTKITTNDLDSKRPLAAWYPWRTTINRE